MYTDDIAQMVQEVWKYLAVKGLLVKSDLVFVLGRDDFNITEKAAELYEKELAPCILLSGGRGRLTGAIKGSEAQAFADTLQKKGIPREAVILEEESTNTGENIDLGLKLLRSQNIPHRTIILVTHGPHMRRALAVAQANDSTINWIPCPDDCDALGEQKMASDETIKELAGEINRLVEYPQEGFFAEQDVPIEIQEWAEKVMEEK